MAVQPVGRHLHEAVVGPHHAAHVGQAPQMDVDLAGPRLQPPGIATRALPEPGHQRPHDLDGGPHALHQFVGRHVRLHRGRCRPSWCRRRTPPPPRGAPGPRAWCARPGCRGRCEGRWCRAPADEAAISLRAEFFAPETATCPAKPPPAPDERRGSPALQGHASGHLRRP